MFDSIYSANVTAAQFFIMAGVALGTGVLYAWLMSFRVRSQSRFFAVAAIIPFAVASIVTFVKGNIGAGVAIGGGVFGLIRFRSAQGSSDEIAAILIAMCGGIAFGMGFIGYGILIILGLAALYFLISGVPMFRHKKLSSDMLLRITIPEDLDYNGTFNEIFDHYLSSYESDGVKTTGMGSMFRLSFKVRLKNPAEEKALIDELRTKNGNLEIALSPYVDKRAEL